MQHYHILCFIFQCFSWPHFSDFYTTLKGKLSVILKSCFRMYFSLFPPWICLVLFLRYKNWRLINFLLWHWSLSGIYLHSPGQVINTIQHLYYAISLFKIINWFHLIKYKTRWSQSVYPMVGNIHLAAGEGKKDHSPSPCTRSVIDHIF